MVRHYGPDIYNIILLHTFAVRAHTLTHTPTWVALEYDGLALINVGREVLGDHAGDLWVDDEASQVFAGEGLARVLLHLTQVQRVVTAQGAELI